MPIRRSGAAGLAVEGEGLRLDLATGAKLRLAHRDGDVFTATLVPDGRFDAVAQNLGKLPLGFVQFITDKDGKRSALRFTAAQDGQVLEFTRQ